VNANGSEEMIVVNARRGALTGSFEGRDGPPTHRVEMSSVPMRSVRERWSGVPRRPCRDVGDLRDVCF
jgi:hypothetical protein